MAVKKAVKKPVAKKAAASKGATMLKKKPAAKKPVMKKAAMKKAVAKKSAKKGDLYECEECGLVLTVFDTCDCDGPCDVMCCDEPMILLSKLAKR
jgi:hypothetical protein